MASQAGDDKTVLTKRIFVNCVDSYQGENIGRYLSQCAVGASLDEGEEEEEETGSNSGDATPESKEGTFQIYGTLKNQNNPKPDFVKEILKSSDRDQLLEQLVELDIIVYDISEDPSQIDEVMWAISALHAEMGKLQKSKMFILVSPAMTWAKSEPLDPDDPEIPFTEDDYRRRKPHPSFKEHIAAEKTVIKLGKTNKSKLVSYVIASGLTYGCGENIFHYLFKTAWHNAPELQCFGPGKNVVPTIHIRDLAAVIQNIADSKPKVRYLLAVDDSNNTMEEIVKAVSEQLGSGQIKTINKEDALLSKSIEQADFDQLLVDLRMDAIYVKENMRIRWASETGIVENIEKIVNQYKEARRLIPMRVFITGPPASGKTTLVQKLCQHYKLHHVHIKAVIEEALEKLECSKNRADVDDTEDDDGKAQEDAELLEAIEESKENGRIEDQYVIRFFKEKLHSKPCKNQGFILDGFPKSLQQAKDLFAASEEEEEAEGSVGFDKNIMPEIVINLQASDDFLRVRVMNLPESVVANTHNTEDGLLKRLAEYAKVNTDDETVINYFDQYEIEINKMNVEEDTSNNMEETAEKVIKLLGKPRNYGPTAEELEESQRLEEERRLQNEATAKSEREKKEAEEASERKRKQEEWTTRLEEVKREEAEMLESQALPLRNYLMKHVMPTLTQGLMDCCKVRPDDPIDYLAEFLFKHNPQIE